LLEVLPNLDVTLIDLSRPMLERAVERIGAAASGRIRPLQGDIREIGLGEAQFDVILAGAVFHHLRTDDEWEAVFAKCFAALRPGGSFWISDLIEHTHPAVQAMRWEAYGEHLTKLTDEAYRDRVFQYIKKGDATLHLAYQLDLLRRVGDGYAEIIHKRWCFAAFGGVKG